MLVLRVRSEYSIRRSRGEFVLVDQPSEAVASTDVPRTELQILRRRCCHQRRSRSWPRDLLRYPLVRAMAVVVPGVAAQDALEVPCVHDKEMVEALGSDGSHKPLGVGIRIRRPEWRLEDTGTFRSKDLIEAGDVLGVPVADEILGLDALVDDVTGHVPGLLGDPGRMGMGGDAGDPDPSAAELDEEQDVEALQQKRVDGEEVGGDDVGGLGPQERPPRGAASPRSRPKVVILHDPGDRASRQVDTELDQLTLDAAISPPGVLSSQAHHEGRDFVIDARTSWSAVRVSPAPSHQTAMPGEQRLRRHAENTPATPGKQSAKCRKKRTIRRREVLALDLVTQWKALVGLVLSGRGRPRGQTCAPRLWRRGALLPAPPLLGASPGSGPTPLERYLVALAFPGAR